MTVAELIEELRKLPQNTEVVVGDAHCNEFYQVLGGFVHITKGLAYVAINTSYPVHR